MKTLRFLTILTILSFAVGCNKTTESESSTSERQASIDSGALPPTSNTTNRINRTYAGDTNDVTTKAPDNTGINARDRSDLTLTPGDQGNSESDRDITRRIRRTITQKDELSTTAKNIKIITANGKVTLRGPVNSEQEAKAIMEAAQSIAGPESVDNQLETKTNNP